MQRLIKTAILTAVVLTVAASLATTADEPRDRDAPPKRVAARSAVLQQYLRLQRQAVETVEDPLLAGAIGIHKIKEIAVKSGKLKEGADALRLVAAETGRPALRRLALLALAELQMAAGKPAEAIESLAELCLESDEEEDGEPARGIHGRGRCPCKGEQHERREHPERQEGEQGERPEHHEREERQERERHERREPQERERRERHEMEQMRLRREHGPREMDRGGPDIRQMLERRSRELDEKARHIEQRMEELKRWAQELERRERGGHRE